MSRQTLALQLMISWIIRNSQLLFSMECHIKMIVLLGFAECLSPQTINSYEVLNYRAGIHSYFTSGEWLILTKDLS